MEMKWQAIETIPDDDRTVLICMSGGDMFTAPASKMVPLSLEKRLAMSESGAVLNPVRYTPMYWCELPPAPPLLATDTLN